MPRVLVPLADGFEEVEAIAPVDVLRRAGVEVTIAALGEHIHATSKNGITVHADTTLGAVGASARYDAVLLPGGPGVKHLRADSRVRDLVLAHHSAQRWVAAICAAPTVLKDCGLLEGRRYTAHASVASELPNILASERVVIDGNIVTSRGAGTALDFGLKLVELLVSPAKSREVAESIHI